MSLRTGRSVLSQTQSHTNGTPAQQPAGASAPADRVAAALDAARRLANEFGEPVSICLGALMVEVKGGVCYLSAPV